MTTITREKVKQQLDRHEGATLVEVLDEDHYQEFHLPGAINVPLSEEFERRIADAVPIKDERVILYCQDVDCPASAQAAERMETMGYSNVYDYEAGKADWKRAGLPIES
jgi:rhodanese-related sulfurtransferase